MAEGIDRHGCTPTRENKTGTFLTAAGVAVTIEPRAPRAGRCGYVVAAGRAPFCDRPALPGGSYCARHRARCTVAPASPGFAALAALQVRVASAPPPELAGLGAPAPPEPVDENDDERLAGLDLPPTAISRDE